MIRRREYESAKTMSYTIFSSQNFSRFLLLKKSNSLQHLMQLCKFLWMATRSDTMHFLLQS